MGAPLFKTNGWALSSPYPVRPFLYWFYRRPEQKIADDFEVPEVFFDLGVSTWTDLKPAYGWMISLIHNYRKLFTCSHCSLPACLVVMEVGLVIYFIVGRPNRFLAPWLLVRCGYPRSLGHSTTMCWSPCWSTTLHWNSALGLSMQYILKSCNSTWLLAESLSAYNILLAMNIELEHISIFCQVTTSKPLKMSQPFQLSWYRPEQPSISIAHPVVIYVLTSTSFQTLKMPLNAHKYFVTHRVKYRPLL